MYLLFLLQQLLVTASRSVAKVVRDTKNAKKQKENIPADTFNDFYEEELNWWDKDLKEGEK